MTSWDGEYLRKGIPSSFRDEPSTVMKWAASNWVYLTNQPLPHRALDVGCGTGRNSVYLARLGVEVYAFDSSVQAVRAAEERAFDARLERAPHFTQHDLARGLPLPTHWFDCVCDIFVYKHQLDPSARRAYRGEVARVLTPEGRFVVSLAHRDDGYYAACPRLSAPPAGDRKLYIIDPAADVGSVLYTLDEMVDELGDYFELEMSWNKVKHDVMHGGTYERQTLATIWRRRHGTA